MAWMTSCVVMGVVVWTLAVLMVSPVGAGGLEEPSPDNAACCSPDQWEGRQLVSYVQTGFPPSAMSMMETLVTYDAVNEREAYTTTQMDAYGNVKKFKFIGFYKNFVGYTYNLLTGVCEIQPLGSFNKRCIPAATAKVLDSDVTLGTGANNVTGKRVYYEVPTQPSTTYAVVLLTDECIPVHETRQRAVALGTRLSFSTLEDVTVGIKSEDIFELPAACENIATGKRSNPKSFDLGPMHRVPE